MHLCMKIRWDDLEALLEVWRAGTQERAAQALGVDQATVSRRITRLEQAANAKLFVRRGGRLVPTAAGQMVLSRLGGVDEAIGAARSALAAAAAIGDATVRVAAPPLIVERILVPGIGFLIRRYPGVRIDLVGGEGVSAAQGVDLELRLGRPKDGAGPMRHIATIGYRVYAPSIDPEAPGWIGFAGELETAPEGIWAAENVPRARVLVRVESVLAVAAAVARGAGRGLLPVFIGRRENGILPVSDVVLSREVWIVAGEGLNESPPIIATRRWIEDAFGALHLTETHAVE